MENFSGDHPFAGIGALRKPRGKYFNKEINDVYLKAEALFYNDDGKYQDAAFDYYLEVADYLINFAKVHGSNTYKKLDECGIIEEFVDNVLQDFEIVLLNADSKLELILDYLDRLLQTFKMDLDSYEATIRAKCSTLFKLGKYKEGELLIVDFLKTHEKRIFAYVELVDQFLLIKDYKNAKKYYDIGMAVSKISADDKECLEERFDDWYEKA